MELYNSSIEEERKLYIVLYVNDMKLEKKLLKKIKIKSAKEYR